MATPKKVIDYVMNTPCNTNRAVLRSLLDGLSEGGSSLVSLKVGKTTTGEPGTNAVVVNSGTEERVVLDFTIPRGDTGESPQIGENNNWYIGGVDTGKPAYGADQEARDSIKRLEDSITLATGDEIDGLFVR